MPQLTTEQQRAVAIAAARLRLQQAGSAPAKPAAGPLTPTPPRIEEPPLKRGLTAGMETVTDILEPFSFRDTQGWRVPPAIKAIGNLPQMIEPFTKAASQMFPPMVRPSMPTPDPQAQEKMISIIEESVLAPIKPPFEMGKAALKGDIEGLTKAAADTITTTLPAIYGAGQFGKGAVRLGTPLKYGSLTPVQRDAALGSIAQTGIQAKGISPYKIGAESRQGVQQAFHELGVDPQKALPLKNRSTQINEMVVGGTADELAQVNKILKAEHDAAIAAGKLPEGTPFMPEESIQLAAADRMVDIYHRPIQRTVDVFAQVKRPDVKAKVYNDLLQRAGTEAAGNPALSTAFKNAAEQVAKTDDTVQAIYALKVKANKMPSPAYRGTPSQQISADVLTAEAQVELASSIRKHLYPALEQIGKLNGQDMTGKLIAAGRRETSAIALRDGIYNEWSRAAFAQAGADLESWWHHTIRGHSESVPVFGQGTVFRRASAVNAIVRGISGVEKPMRDLNKRLAEGIGPMQGFKPEQVAVTPRREIAALSEVPEPELPPLRRSTWGDIPPAGPTSRVKGVELSPERMIGPGSLGGPGRPLQSDVQLRSRTVATEPITPPTPITDVGAPATREIRKGLLLEPGRPETQRMPAYGGGRADVSSEAPGAAYPAQQPAYTVGGYIPTSGPAKGMKLLRVELHPVTDRPVRYIYEDATGKRRVFKNPQR